MKIDEIYQHIGMIDNSRDTTANTKAEEQNGNVHDLQKGEKPVTEVDFSKTSVEFSKVAEMMEKIPEERVQKINDIKARIQDGTYSVDATEVADKILKGIISDLV